MVTGLNVSGAAGFARRMKVITKYIDNEDKARLAVEAWKKEPAAAQVRHLQLAIESLELGRMYYEQKGSEKGVGRMARCIVLLQQRRDELAEQAQPQT